MNSDVECLYVRGFVTSSAVEAGCVPRDTTETTEYPMQLVLFSGYSVCIKNLEPVLSLFSYDTVICIDNNEL